MAEVHVIPDLTNTMATNQFGECQNKSVLCIANSIASYHSTLYQQYDTYKILNMSFPSGVVWLVPTCTTIVNMPNSEVNLSINHL